MPLQFSTGGIVAAAWIDRQYADETFDEGDLSGTELRECHFERCTFKGVYLDDVTTHNCVFTQCDFAGARFNGSEHQRSAFLNCKFRKANLFLCRFDGCKLTGTSFEEAKLDGMIVQGGDWSYVNLRHHSLKELDLQGVRFAEAELYGCNLEKVDLRDADLTRANLQKARLSGADLRGANVEGVNLEVLDLLKVKLDLAQCVALARSHGAIVEFD